MRDTNDMMEDAISEDTMMECSGDGGGLADLVDLATDIADSAPSIRDAAERLLTLLGVDDEDDASSSEDEGVEVDLDESDDEEPQDARLFHQLAASLAQELKYAKQNASNSKIAQSQPAPTNHARDTVQSMDVAQESNLINDYVNQNTLAGNFRQILQSQDPSGKNSNSHFYQTNDACTPNPYQFPSNATAFASHVQGCPGKPTIHSQTEMGPAHFQSSLMDPRLRVESGGEIRCPENFPETSSWGAGWDACTSEALRYLVEDEGLPPHHPTVIAMKNHLDLQRERVFAQYTT